MEYTHNELRILWHLKRNNGMIQNQSGVIRPLAETLDMRIGTVSYIVKGLEEKCLLVRTFGDRRPRGVATTLITKLELIDPQMYLPPLPAPMPLAAVLNHENDEMYDRTACEPTDEAIILALVTENEKLRFQISKLQDIVNAQAKEIMQLKEHQSPKSRDPHLNQRARDSLPPEVWDQLHHKGRR